MKRKEKRGSIQQKRGCEESEVTPGPKEGPPQGGVRPRTWSNLVDP